MHPAWPAGVTLNPQNSGIRNPNPQIKYVVPVKGRRRSMTAHAWVAAAHMGDPSTVLLMREVAGAEAGVGGRGVLLLA